MPPPVHQHHPYAAARNKVAAADMADRFLADLAVRQRHLVRATGRGDRRQPANRMAYGARVAATGDAGAAAHRHGGNGRTLCRRASAAGCRSTVFGAMLGKRRPGCNAALHGSKGRLHDRLAPLCRRTRGHPAQHRTAVDAAAKKLITAGQVSPPASFREPALSAEVRTVLAMVARFATASRDLFNPGKMHSDQPVMEG